jgi:hypothetical protein
MMCIAQLVPLFLLSQSFAGLQGHGTTDGGGVCAVEWHRGLSDRDIAGSAVGYKLRGDTQSGIFRPRPLFDERIPSFWEKRHEPIRAR